MDTSRSIHAIHEEGAGGRGLIAFVVSRYGSHIYSTLGLARRLKARGFDVEYWGEAAARRLVQTQGFAFHELEVVWVCYEGPLLAGHGESLPSQPREYMQALMASRRRRRDVPAALKQFERSVDRQLARRPPRMILLDPLTAAYVPLLLSRGLKCVVLQDKPLPTPDPLVPPPTSDLIPCGTRFGRARVCLCWAQHNLEIAAYGLRNRALGLVGAYTPERLIAEIRARACIEAACGRIRRRVTYDLNFEAVDEWVLGSPEADFPRVRALPRNVWFVGSCVDLERFQVPVPFGDDAQRKKLIYVSMGISVPHWTADLTLLRRVIAAFASVPHVWVWIATGNVKATAVLGRGVGNVRVFPFLPQLSILRCADLAITHAGANAYRECIATNTPMLAFPREYDQRGNAARVVYHGLGLRGSRWLDSAAAVRRRALRILEDDGFARRVSELNEMTSRGESRLLDAALDAALGA